MLSLLWMTWFVPVGFVVDSVTLGLTFLQELSISVAGVSPLMYLTCIYSSATSSISS